MYVNTDAGWKVTLCCLIRKRKKNRKKIRYVPLWMPNSLFEPINDVPLCLWIQSIYMFLRCLPNRWIHLTETKVYWYNIWLPLSSCFKWVLCCFLSTLDTRLFLCCYNAAWLRIIYDLFKCYYLYEVQLVCMNICFWKDIGFVFDSCSMYLTV
jgi:hypothetical protein